MASFDWLEDTLFVDTLFPLALSTGATVNYEFQTLITRVDNGFETRNPRWNTPLRSYTLRTARSLEDLHTLREFYTIMRGRQRSFRFLDFTEFTSSNWATGDNAINGPAISPLDQNIGTGDGVTGTFQLRKQYIVGANTINRNITLPVAGTVRIAVGGSELLNAGSPSDFSVDHTTGIVSFATPPASLAAVTAGYKFHVPVRFDVDILAANLETTFEVEASGITLREVRVA